MEHVKRVLVFVAHSDDQVIGPGGTIAKLAKEGVEVRTFVCSFGELTHPHLKAVEVRKMRVRESQQADKVLGGKGVFFMGMREGHFLEDFEEKRWHSKLLRHCKDFKPDRIFTHASDDPHPDHRAVHKMLLTVHKDLRYPCEVYTFDVWNLFSLKRRKPKLVVDISATFTRKLDAISMFRSQKVAVFVLLWSVYTKAFFNGLRRNCRYAELFHKVR